MDMKEHVYADDPKVGHPDVRTYLGGVDYFFLGNGYIQAAVQFCRSGEGTALGLLVMHPEKFGPKRAALTCNEEGGITGTVLKVRVGENVYSPAGNDLLVEWDSISGLPAVRAVWEAGPCQVVESFFCPDRISPRIYRKVVLTSKADFADEVFVSAGEKDAHNAELRLQDGRAKTLLSYEIARDDGEPVVVARWVADESISGESQKFWSNLNSCDTGDASLDHLFATARNQLPTAVDATGRMDGSIWQYNLEWVRDQSHVAEALVRLGENDRARTMLARMLDDFVSDTGDVIDSGRNRDPIEVELDQNGELLTALRTYVDWTGDLELVRERWDRVKALASFPLQDCFRHEESGLLHNAREYWERHGGHGIQDGFELMHQFFVALGLENAAYLSEVTGCDAARDEWRKAASEITQAFLEDPKYRLIENGHFIKRRGLDGSWHRTIVRSDECVLPPEIPLMEDGPRALDPDTSSVLPIACEFVDPKGEVAAKTLEHMEEIWNQRWPTGGYGRYNAESEADSAGPWPFGSLFVARACVEAGDYRKVWRILRWLSRGRGSVSGSWFEFFGDRIAPPYAQNGIIPWTWAEMITLFVHHIVGVRPDLEGVTVRPRLLSGLDQMKATIDVRGQKLNIVVSEAETDSQKGALANGVRIEWTETGIRLPVPTSDQEVQVYC